MLVSACSNTEEFCCGYSVLDQGGSKRSLMRSGLVVESYIVTGVFTAQNVTVFELRPYGADECRYRVATPPEKLSPAMPLSRLDDHRFGLASAVKGGSFIPQSSRSCLGTPLPAF